MTARLPWFVGFLARRLVWAFITMLIFVGVLLAIMEVWVPYNWAVIHTRQPSDAAATAQTTGLDIPFPLRYAEYVVGLIQGDLGESFGGSSVSGIIIEALPVTLTVFLVGAVLGWVIGEVLGRIGSWNRSIVTRSGFSIVAVASAAMFPPFLVFVLVTTLREPMLASREVFGLPEDSLVLWRDAELGTRGALLPADVWWVLAWSLSAAVVGGLLARAIAQRRGHRLVAMLAMPAALTGVCAGIGLSGIGAHALDIMYRANVAVTTHRLDPTGTGLGAAVTIGRGSPAVAMIGVALLTFGSVMLLMRTSMDIQRTEEYVSTGRAKGLPEHVVRDHHAARNAIPPVLAGSLLTFPTVLAGMMIVEFEFQLQGLSSVLFSAVETQDIPLISGVLFALGLIGVGLRVVTDVVVATLDPRRRRTGPIPRLPA
ncbi:MAG TPA: ABC transporter permease [Candidatus Limnocylindria bacterium]|nr:ABC transporter permease [Candidatus Limnocylindria bacterium]